MRPPRLALFATLVLAALLPLSALAASPVAGTDYVVIADGQPFAPQPGKIEVVEVFGYTCSHCARFEPLVSAWKARLPADVEFVTVPAPFGGYWIPYAQAYYAAQAQGLADRAHAAVFSALHEQHSLPIVDATPSELATFYATLGADPEQFARDMASAETEAELERARGFIRRSGIEGTPTLVVAGKYRVLGKSFQQSLDIASALVERERAEIQGAATR